MMSLLSHADQTESELNQIQIAKRAADTEATARRMIEPVRGPDPIKPLPTPVSHYELPRALQDFDFGPKPIKGVAQTQVPSWGSVFANAVAAGAGAWKTGTGT